VSLLSNSISVILTRLAGVVHHVMLIPWVVDHVDPQDFHYVVSLSALVGLLGVFELGLTRFVLSEAKINGAKCLNQDFVALRVALQICYLLLILIFLYATEFRFEGFIIALISFFNFYNSWCSANAIVSNRLTSSFLIEFVALLAAFSVTISLIYADSSSSSVLISWVGLPLLFKAAGYRFWFSSPVLRYLRFSVVCAALARLVMPLPLFLSVLVAIFSFGDKFLISVVNDESELVMYFIYQRYFGLVGVAVSSFSPIVLNRLGRVLSLSQVALMSCLVSAAFCGIIWLVSSYFDMSRVLGVEFKLWYAVLHSFYSVGLVLFSQCLLLWNHARDGLGFVFSFGCGCFIIFLSGLLMPSVVSVLIPVLGTIFFWFWVVPATIVNRENSWA
jgi:hypothetical protein